MNLIERTLLGGLLLCFLPSGLSLKCYSYVCSNSSVGSTPNCDPPQEITCVPMHGFPMAPDRCVTQRIKMEMVGIVVHQEIRNCSYSATCLPGLICNAANASGLIKKCEIGCCQGDLCNSGGPIPTQEPKPIGPSGADLSCYSCSNVPGLLSNGADCKNPAKRTCGASPSGLGKQDRCLTIKIRMKVPSVGFFDQEMRNCSDATYCNRDFICRAANASGMLSSCQLSCCYGNLCNTGIAVPTISSSTTSSSQTTANSTTANSTTANSTTANSTTVNTTDTTAVDGKNTTSGQPATFRQTGLTSLSALLANVVVHYLLG